MSNSLEIVNKFLENKINIRRVTDSIVSFSFDETTSMEDIAELIQILCKIKGKDLDIDKIFLDAKSLCKPLAENIRRKSKFM